jgi:glycosyltransferase involved in cell wall biosynthesis
MNGGMDYPRGFRNLQSSIERLSLWVGRRLANVMNWLIPGKREAALLLVANERTRAALPEGVCDRVETLVENGVDLSLWSTSSQARDAPLRATRYVFVGRLVDWKAVDLLLLAFKRAAMQVPVSLSIVGEGVERKRLEQLARNLGVLNLDTSDQIGKTRFLGWMSQSDCVNQLHASDALVLPSLMECGGAVVLEAMAMEIPVIATNWGGPADYLDSSCGILVEPTTREDFIGNIAAALISMATSPHERIAMGKAARAKVIQHFDWEVKVDRILEMYRKVCKAPISNRTTAR